MAQVAAPLAFVAVERRGELVGLAVFAPADAVGMGSFDEVVIANMAQVWLVSTLLFVAFMAVAFAVSVESDRAGPAIGIPAVFILLNYLAFTIGGIWPDVGFLEDWSMFNLLKAQQVLDEGVALGDVVVLLGFIALFAAIAFYRFPKRDLPAPA